MWRVSAAARSRLDSTRLGSNYRVRDTRVDVSQLLKPSKLTATTTTTAETLLVLDDTRDASASAPSESEIEKVGCYSSDSLAWVRIQVQAKLILTAILLENAHILNQATMPEISVVLVFQLEHAPLMKIYI